VLSLFLVQILAIVNVAALFGGFILGHVLARSPRGPARVVARRNPGRWTEVLWVVGALVSAFWSFGVLFAPAVAYHWPAVPDFPLSSEIQVAGFLVALSAGLLFFVAVRAMGAQMTPEIRVQEGHRLVQEGPYRRIRHPLYTAIVAGAGGLAFLYLSLPLGILALVLAALAVYRAGLEEDLLRSQEGFGRTYTEYVARTGRFLPRFRRRE